MATCIYTWSDIRTDWLLKGKLTQKWKYCHQLYILVSFQTHMSYFLCGAQIEMIRRMWMLHIHWKCIKSNHSIPQNISFSIYTVLIKSYGFGPTWWLNDERNAFFDGCTTPLTLIGLRWNKKKNRLWWRHFDLQNLWKLQIREEPCFLALDMSNENLDVC